jgi:plasmid stability protein
VASITIRKLDEPTKTRLRLRAARHGQSMEEEARQILKSVLVDRQEPQRNLAETIRARFAPLGGVRLAEFPRTFPKKPPDFK